MNLSDGFGDSFGTIVIRGGGDLATGVAQKFHRAGFPAVILESPSPTAIRRSVALSEAVYDGTAHVEDITCKLIDHPDQMPGLWRENIIPLLIDPMGRFIPEIKPVGVIDAIIAKKNLGTLKALAPVTVALGPGFRAPDDVDAVIETMRGHNLGRMITDGCATPNTGTPGLIGGRAAERVLHAPASGKISLIRHIGDIVKEGEILFTVGDIPVTAPFTGLVRGMIREGYLVSEGMKVADIDPRTDIDWRTISDKARCLGGAALEAFLHIYNRVPLKTPFSPPEAGK